ncbi:MAG: hypothetical protein ABEJ98_05220 [Candidatus Nanohaloarchaea archaeon]
MMVPVLEVSNLAITLLLLVEVANMKQALRESQQVQLDEPPVIALLKGLQK